MFTHCLSSIHLDTNLQHSTPHIHSSTTQISTTTTHNGPSYLLHPITLPNFAFSFLPTSPQSSPPTQSLISTQTSITLYKEPLSTFFLFLHSCSLRFSFRPFPFLLVTSISCSVSVFSLPPFFLLIFSLSLIFFYPFPVFFLSFSFLCLLLCFTPFPQAFLCSFLTFFLLNSLQNKPITSLTALNSLLYTRLLLSHFFLLHIYTTPIIINSPFNFHGLVPCISFAFLLSFPSIP